CVGGVPRKNTVFIVAAVLSRPARGVLSWQAVIEDAVLAVDAVRVESASSTDGIHASARERALIGTLACNLDVVNDRHSLPVVWQSRCRFSRRIQLGPCGVSRACGCCVCWF